MLLAKRGCVVVGPHSNVDDALAAATDEQDLAGALLDINLNGRLVYPVADELTRRRIPFIFLTGYAASSLPPEFASAAILEKPFSSADFEAAFRKCFGAGVS
jgi:CheY-like chemotaxis protein